MKMVSRFALAAMLSLGAVSLTSAPAFAQKKGEQQKPDEATAKLLTQLSPEYRKLAGAAETSIGKSDWAAADTELAAAEAVAKNDAEKYFAARMRYTIEFNRKSDDGMVKALDALLANPNTPKELITGLTYSRGEIPFRQKKRAEALPFLLKARELGSTEQGLQLMIAQSYFDSGNLNQGVAELGSAIDKEKAAGRKAPDDWYNFIIQRLYKAGDRTATTLWLTKQFSDYPKLDTWHKIVMLYRESKDKAGTPLDIKQKIDLYRLLRATGALADVNDYGTYAQAAVNRGIPWESLAVIDEGLKAQKFTLEEPSIAAIKAAAVKASANDSSLDTYAKQAAAAPTGKEAANTAEGYLGSGNYAKAVELYDMALKKGSVDNDEVNLNRGVALYRLGRKDEAKASFDAVQAGVLKDIAKFWITWIELPAPPTA
ncbi:tetratricopeptide repeat protein [Sphingomonas sp.]|uniref:tetratricopeptide repeat protein n=1 Tax=Sphingomonas sp. TaxID=28214 RepID=UPI001B119F1C|nr:tetratricopeptide repeat protein [Sphingomonas sp.]MBO9712021.1 tetratricopeptide repeat protein [Sphingomonas sp.]